MPHKVAIILRTKNRPIFLRRALKSLAEQTFQDFCIYLINDGGNIDNLNKCIEENTDFIPNRIVRIDIPTSVGRGHALNIGLGLIKEKYIHIHDDDDTLAPDFLSQTVSYLENDSKNIFSGVTTSNYDVFEHIENDEIITDNVTDKYGVKSGTLIDYSLYLSHMMIIMPITLLFRKSSITDLNGINTDLSYVEDHDFFLRILLNGEIGIISQPLCYYHQRPHMGDSSDTSRHEVNYSYEISYKNSIIRDAIRGKGRLKELQAIFTHDNHVMRQYNNHISQQINQLRDEFTQLSHLLVQLIGKINSQ